MANLGFNNKFQNTENVKGAGTSGYNWNQIPERGTNINGGPHVAGNYWSNPSGTGWSDTHSQSSSGYTKEPYNVEGSSYDQYPLVNTPTIAPTSSPTQIPDTSVTIKSSQDESSKVQTSPLTTNIDIRITSAVLSADAKPGDSAKLSLSLENTGGLVLPSGTKIVLVPKNDAAQKTGEVSLQNDNGKFSTTITVIMPKEPGTIEYLYQPYQVVNKPAGKDSNPLEDVSAGHWTYNHVKKESVGHNSLYISAGSYCNIRVSVDQYLKSKVEMGTRYSF